VVSLACIRASSVFPANLRHQALSFLELLLTSCSALLLGPELHTRCDSPYAVVPTCSYGDETLEAFFEKAVKEGLKGQELGDQAVFGLNEE